MKTEKRQLLSENLVEKYTVIFLMVAVLFLIIAEIYPEAAEAGDALNASGFPLGSFFAGGGIVFLIIGIGLLLVIFKSAFGAHRR